MKRNVKPSVVDAPDHDNADYGIEAHASLSAQQLRVLKHGEAFALLDIQGECGSARLAAGGIYFRDTRYLSRWRLTLARQPLLMLSSTVQDDNSALTVTLTNPDMELASGRFRKDAIAITRTTFIWDGASFERIGLRNYDHEGHDFVLEIAFDADFLDLFEVRGMDRKARGSIIKGVEDACAVFRYSGLDDIARETRVEFDPPPSALTSARATFEISLPPGGRTAIFSTVRFREAGRDVHPAASYLAAYRRKRRDTRALTDGIATIQTSNDVFNELLCRSTSDVYMLLAKTKDGLYPHAGIPWYSTVFGRDGLITALFMLWVDPAIARGVLLHLAAMQAHSIDDSRDAQPGKILHEQRGCETARTGEVPFAAYYGTVDATPLFVVLAGRYFRRTGDIETIRRIWPNIKAALSWCNTYGDRDGDGLVEYFRETPSGLSNQGWKDSYDSIFHAEGQLAEGPIALVEVQAYVYEAKLLAAELADRLADASTAAGWRREAADLRQKFSAAFWIEELGTFALALDGRKRPCRVSSSNAGHVLLTDLASAAQAARVAASLFSADLFCGWGVRTVAASAARYNPMSYHNGSVWPHDNALIGLGLGRHGLKTHLCKIFEGLHCAQSYQADRRLPELFCGFQRKRGRGPVSYPVSCSPQAWASATPFALLGACLGLEIDHERRVVLFDTPVLPAFLDEVTLRNVSVGEASIDVKLSRIGSGVALSVLAQRGDVQAMIGT